MTNSTKYVTYDGGCHCEAIRFRVIVFEHLAVDCNCSICLKKGFIHLIVPPEQFTLLKGSDALMTYTFNTHTAKHHFCRFCGIHPFYRPRSHPHSIDVNVRCLDGEALSCFKIKSFNGINWEENVNEIQK